MCLSVVELSYFKYKLLKAGRASLVIFNNHVMVMVSTCQTYYYLFKT